MKIYFMGICGTAMGNVAVMLKAKGHDILGSDTDVYEPMKGVLERAGIEILSGWSAARLKEMRPDLVVIGNVISRMNPELEWLWNTREFASVSLAGLIGTHVIGRRKALVASGTHGKTTTTSIAGFILSNYDAGTGWMIGGVPKNLRAGSAFGAESSPFVIEGDEYDTAFFDKRSKFIHYRPTVLLINNIEFDHADIFRDLADVKRAFTHVRRIVSGSGTIIENGDDENIASLEDTPWVGRTRVGFGKNCDLQISDFRQSAQNTSFKLSFAGETKEVFWRMQGEYNARNAAMALAGAAAILGLKSPLDIRLDLLAQFEGVARRQEIILEGGRVCAVEDFGHHPTALAGTIRSLRQKFEGYKIYACFEPRSNTAKTSVFQNEFAESLNLADKAYLGPAPNSSKIKESERIDTKAMARKFAGKFLAFDANAALYDKLSADVSRARGKIVCVFFSNGSFDGIQKKFAQNFKE